MPVLFCGAGELAWCQQATRHTDGITITVDGLALLSEVLCQAGYGEQVYNLFDVYEIEAVQALVPEKYEEFADALMALATEGGGL